MMNTFNKQLKTSWPLGLQLVISTIKAIGFSLILFICTQPFAHASTALLKGFQLEQALSGTRVVLLTSEAVNYRVQESNDQKIVLEVDNVKSSQRMATQLNQSRNVHHVAIKALPGNSLRLTIYGDKLGHPFVSFKATEAPYTSAISTRQETPSLKTATTASPVAEDEEAFSLPVIAEGEADSTTNSKAPVVSSENEALDMTTLATDEKEIPATATNTDRKAFEGGPIEIEVENNTDDSEKSMLDTVLDFLVHIKLKDIFTLTAISGILLVGLWLAIRVLQKKENGEFSPQQYSQQIIQPKKPGLLTRTLSSVQHLLGMKPRKKQQGKKLFKQASANQAAQSQRQASSMGGQYSPQQNGYASQNPQVNQLLSKNQASRAYTGQNQAQLPPNKKSFKDNELERELKRSLDMKYRMGGYNANRSTTKQPANLGAPQQPKPNRPVNPQANIANGNRIRPENISDKPSVQKPTNPNINATGGRQTIAQGQDIPENKEVLDFLRSVADLMEKDGKPNLAQDIKRAITDS